jgi:hypothetical protein
MSNMQVNNMLDVPRRAKRRKAIVLGASEAERLRLALSSKSTQSNTMQTQSRSSTTEKRSVLFDTVTVRSYERIAIPCPRCVAFISIGWRYAQAETLSIDEYEQQREPLRNHGLGIVMSVRDRRNLLINRGFSYSDIIGKAAKVKDFAASQGFCFIHEEILSVRYPTKKQRLFDVALLMVTEGT